ncbi:MAG: F0F1 ATP synthase subunit delta [Gammaproteobacteria bacterium]|nr:F0F1 ATP synthase subunit delta [Gammaproteobacteria bacterium]
MADYATLARPYARAAFEYAQAHDLIRPWREFLDRLAGVSALAPVHDLIATPVVSRARRAEVLADVAGAKMPDGGGNFLHLLADNGRLAALPAVAEEFARLEEQMEATAEVVIETAVELGKGSATRLVAALGKRLGRELEAQFRVTPDIIGGVVVRIGDEVIDASLATRLARLANQMSA